MIKGAQKKMIVIRTAQSPIFEEAYFVMRGGQSRDERDMIDEANRIIDASGLGRNDKRENKRKMRDRTRSLIIALCGFLGGSAIGVAVTLTVVFMAL